MNSQPSFIPSKSESFDNGFNEAIFMYSPGEIPAKIHFSPWFSIIANEVTKPGILV